MFRFPTITTMYIALILASAVCSCGKGTPKDKAPTDLTEYKLVYGGDFVLGRNFNRALFDDRARKSVFGNLKNAIKKADVALINAEGVIAQGGMFADKGEPRPYMFRAHPSAIDVLVDVGIDVVTVGNNHSGDYGPLALREMLDRLTQAGIGYTGGGQDLADARMPYYQTVGDTVIAIVGADFTIAKNYRARPGVPGILYHDAFRSKKNENKIVKDLIQIMRQARQHAHVVLLTPHWGDNWQLEPAEHIRSLAKKLIQAGYDGIIGHSSHWFHGVEIIEGKPVVYDAGNIVVDYGGGDKAHEAFLWELSFNKAGVSSLKGYPLLLGKNTVNFAKDSIATRMMKKFIDQSNHLGTQVKQESGIAKITCSPGRIEDPKSTRSPPRRRGPPEKIRIAPPPAILAALPSDAVRVNVDFPFGIKLLGYNLLIEEISVPKGAQVVALYFSTDRKIPKNLDIHLEGRKQNSTGTEYSHHLAGDFVFPTHLWPVNEIVVDWTLFRLKGKPEGKVSFYAGLKENGSLLSPIKSDGEVKDGKLIYLGDARYKRGAKTMFSALREYRKRHAASTLEK